MNIDLAIYTAVDSFGWQEQSTYGDDELDKFLVQIRKFPGDLTRKQPFARFFTHNGKFVFARFFETLRFSRSGRNSLYIVLGAIDVKSADRIDFSVLLQMPEIAGPCAPFPSRVEYNGPEAVSSLTIDEKCVDRRFNGSDLLKSIGLIAKNAEELRTEIEDKDGKLYATVTYRPIRRKPALMLSDRMVLTKEPLAELFEALCEVGYRDVVNRCRKEYSDESIPSAAILNDLTRGFIAIRNQIVNRRYLEKKCSETEAENHRIEASLNDANHECQSLRQRLNQAEQELRSLKESQNRSDSSMPEESVMNDKRDTPENDIVVTPSDLKKRKRKMKRISIVGVGGSGKSVLMAVLGTKFKSPNRSGLFLAPVDQATFMHYNGLVAKMLRGEWPSATQPGSVLNLKWTLKRYRDNSSPNELAELHLLDFAGEDYCSAFGGGAVEEFSKEAVESLRSHVSGSDVLLVLMNVNDVIVSNNVQADVQRKLDVQWLTQVILEYARHQRDNVKDCAIVFTNADRNLLGPHGGPQGVLHQHLPDIAASYPEISVFAVSAVNDTAITEDGCIVPAGNFSSTGLDDLMEWVAHKVTRRQEKWFGMVVLTLLVFSVIMCGLGKNGWWVPLAILPVAGTILIWSWMRGNKVESKGK